MANLVNEHLKTASLAILTTISLSSTLQLEVSAQHHSDNEPRKAYEIAGGRKPRVCAGKDGTLHVVFEGLPDSTQSTDVYYSRSTDGGSTWSTALDISHTPGASFDPAVAIEPSGALDVAWEDTSPGAQSPEIFFTRSADGGKTWTNACDISNTAGASTQPAICVGPNGSVHTVWIDTSAGITNPEVFHSVSSNAGETWSKPENVSKTPGISSEPDISIGGDATVHVTWLDTTPGPTHPDVFYSRQTAGSSWTRYVNVSHSPRVSNHPRVATGPLDNVYICWQDNSQKLKAPDIWCSLTTDGATWQKPINMSDTPGVSSEPCIVADEAGALAVAWIDTTTGIFSPDLCSRASLNSAKTFSSIINLSERAGKASSPDITLCNGKIVAVWEETTGDKDSIRTTSSVQLKSLITGHPEYVRLKSESD